MDQYDEKPPAKIRKHKREVMMDMSAEEKPTAEESFLIVMTVNTVQSDTILLKTEPVIVAVINQ